MLPKEEYQAMSLGHLSFFFFQKGKRTEKGKQKLQRNSSPKESFTSRDPILVGAVFQILEP